MNRIARLAFLAACVALLALGWFRERHTVHSLGGNEPQRVNGLTFTEAATYDGYMLRDAKLYEVATLPGASAGEKDCKT